jgi:DNA-binding NarL/FixJ family response regulator
MKTADQARRTVQIDDHMYGLASPLHSAHETSLQLPLHLTPRQLDVLALLCEGLPNKLICRRLNIASGTVKAHISSILRELGVTSRLQAVIVTSRLQAVIAARDLKLVTEGEDAAGRSDRGHPTAAVYALPASIAQMDFGVALERSETCG